MNFNNDMELNVLSCLLIQPELMEQIKVEDKHFIKYKRMWLFMKAFYKKYKTFDIPLMYSVCKTKKDIMTYIELVISADAFPHNFELYQQRLIEIFDESQKESWIINKISDLSNELLVRHINSEQFKVKLNKIYNDAELIFEKK